MPAAGGPTLRVASPREAPRHEIAVAGTSESSLMAASARRSRRAGRPVGVLEREGLVESRPSCGPAVAAPPMATAIRCGRRPRSSVRRGRVLRIGESACASTAVVAARPRGCAPVPGARCRALGKAVDHVGRGGASNAASMARPTSPPAGARWLSSSRNVRRADRLASRQDPPAHHRIDRAVSGIPTAGLRVGAVAVRSGRGVRPGRRPGRVGRGDDGNSLPPRT